jgi:hypothetical protein
MRLWEEGGEEEEEEGSRNPYRTLHRTFLNDGNSNFRKKKKREEGANSSKCVYLQRIILCSSVLFTVIRIRSAVKYPKECVCIDKTYFKNSNYRISDFYVHHARSIIVRLMNW